MSFEHHLTITGKFASLDGIFKKFDRGIHSRLVWNAQPEKLSPEDMQRLLSGMKMVYQGYDHLDLFTNLKPDEVTKFILSKFADVQIKLVEHQAKMAPIKQFNITADSETLESVYNEFNDDSFFGMKKEFDGNGKLMHLIVRHQIHCVRIQIPIQKKFPNVKFSE